MNAPARLAVDFDGATVDLEQWADVEVDNPYFQKVSATPFSSRTGPSVRLEFLLVGEANREFLASDDGLRLTFLGAVQPPEVAAAETSAPTIEDESGLALEILTQEPIAESQQIIEFVEQLGAEASRALTEPEPAAVAAVPEAADSDSVDAEEITLEPASLEPDLAANLAAELPAAELSLPVKPDPAADSVAASPPAPPLGPTAPEPDLHLASARPAEDLLSQPILIESTSHRPERIDFRELEEARPIEESRAVRRSPMLEFPALVQAPSAGSLGAETVQFSEEEAGFTGEPISLDLKDVDIVELLRIFADLSEMNIIIDPDIRGRITIKMRDVPWDQAFVTILRHQGLGFTIEGNIIRIASLRRLNAEIRAQQQLRDARQISEPLNTEIIYLNYAAPGQITRILEGQLSARGQILSDSRTNSLIIRDVQSNINRVKRLIEILDVRTKQITVNAQIVSTAKSFTRDLGVQWGGTMVADPAHGNDTGLAFPNDISTEFGVTLPAGGNGFIGFNFGNLLDTVNLNAVLAASEAEGVTKTISNPRVTTSDNVSASVRSGSLVPYQSSTITGNVAVATIVFREAAVSLSVTPHVTADNYVRMQVTVSSDAPNFSIATPAGPPIETNSLSTTVLVKDGDTFVVGGLNSSIEGANENRVPFLHRLPVLGKILFKNHRTSNAYDDLLMFITPNIVQDEAVRSRSLIFESYERKPQDTEPPPPAPTNP